MPAPTPFEALQADLRAFIAEREWEPFHTPKDLAVATAVEAGELLEIFQWEDPSAEELQADGPRLEHLREEVADVFLFCMLLADALGFDVLQAGHEKLEKNREKYPVELARGRSTKYTDL